MTCAAFFSAAGVVPASTPGAMSDASDRLDRQVTVTADRLVSDRIKRTATFSGRVKVVRGNSTVESDRLTVYYDQNTSRAETERPDRSVIERIVAEGNVRIRSQQLSAQTPKAVYSRTGQTIELLGGGTRVISGGNSITGLRIVLHLEGEQLTVSSGGDNRVKAVLEPSTNR